MLAAAQAAKKNKPEQFADIMRLAAAQAAKKVWVVSDWACYWLAAAQAAKKSQTNQRVADC